MSTVASWHRECQKWASFLNTIVYTGSKKSREIIRDYEWYSYERTKGSGKYAKTSTKATVKFNILITTYEYAISDRSFLKQVPWAYLMVDEAHRLKDSTSLLYQVLSELSTDNRLLITGTPLQNTLRELWCLLHFLEPDKFGSLDEFEENYSGVTEGEGVGDLHQLLLPHLFRRTKKDVLKSLPPKHERILTVDMAPMQRKYYRWIIRGNFRELNKGVRGKKSQLTNICMELRKVTNSPLLFPRAQIDEAMASEAAAAALLQANQSSNASNATVPSSSSPTDTSSLPANVASTNPSVSPDAPLSSPAAPPLVVFDGVEPGSALDGMIRSSGKMILLDKLLLKLKATGHRCLIFSQMVRMLDIISQYCNLRGFLHQRLDGSVSATSRQRSMDHFNAPGSPDFIFLLSTRAGGLGINLTSADTVIIFDSDWNPQNDLQAEARAHRIGQSQTVMVYRLVTRNSVEERILERAKKKMVLDHLVIQRMDTSRNVDSASSSSASKSGAAMFSRAELAKIVQFGAEDLFAQPDDEAKGKQLADLDIDEILSRADANAPTEESAAEEASKHDATEAFLGAFKVANFSSAVASVSEDEEDENEAEEEEEEKDWSKIIPAALIPADQLSADGTAVPLYLPPRARNQVKSYAENHLVAQNERNAKEEGEDGEEGNEDDEEDATNNVRVRKSPHELDTRDVKIAVKALMFTGGVSEAVDEAIRQSWGKRGVDRADATQFIEALIASMKKAIEDAKNKPPEEEKEEEDEKDDPDFDENGEGKKKKKNRSEASVQGEYLGQAFNATDVQTRMDEFAVLHKLIPTKNPLSYRVHTRKSIPPVRWTKAPPGTLWKPQHDSMLLVGVHWYGLNQMDRLVEDERLGLMPMVAVKEFVETTPNKEDEEMKEELPQSEVKPEVVKSEPAEADPTPLTSTTADEAMTPAPTVESTSVAAPSNSSETGTTPMEDVPSTTAPIPTTTTEEVAVKTEPMAVGTTTATSAASTEVKTEVKTEDSNATITPKVEPTESASVASTTTTSPAPAASASSTAPASSSTAPPPASSPSPQPNFVWNRIVKGAILTLRATVLLRALAAEAKAQQEDAEFESERARIQAEKKANRAQAEKNKRKAIADMKEAAQNENGQGNDESSKKKKKSSGSSDSKNTQRIDDMLKKSSTGHDSKSDLPRQSSARSRSPSPSSSSDDDSMRDVAGVDDKSSHKKSKSKKDGKKRHRSRSPSPGSSDEERENKKHKKEKSSDKKSKSDKKKDKKEKEKEKTASKEKSSKKDSSKKGDSKKAQPAHAAGTEFEIDDEVLAQCKPLCMDFAPKLRELHHLANGEGGFAGHKSETKELITYIGNELIKIAKERVPDPGLPRQYLLAHLWEYIGKFTHPKHSAQKLRSFYKLFKQQQQQPQQQTGSGQTPIQGQTTKQSQTPHKVPPKPIGAASAPSK